MKPMQRGDVQKTWADTTLLESMIGTRSKTDLNDGISKFLNWYCEYYNVDNRR